MKQKNLTIQTKICLGIVAIGLALIYGCLYKNHVEYKSEPTYINLSIPEYQPKPLNEEDVYWLAKNVYFEARNQPIDARMGVIHTTFNRVYDHRFPNNIKDVVTERKQFSWYSDGLSDRPTELKAWNESLRLAKDSLRALNNGTYIDTTNGSTHYHADYVYPLWASSDRMTKQITLGAHIHYTWK